MGLDPTRDGQRAGAEEVYGYTVSTDTNIANEQRNPSEYQPQVFGYISTLQGTFAVLDREYELT